MTFLFLSHLQNWTSDCFYICDHKSIFCRAGPRLSETFEDNDVSGTQRLKGNMTAFMSVREKALEGLIRRLCSHFVDAEGVLEAVQIARLQNCYK